MRRIGWGTELVLLYFLWVFGGSGLLYLSLAVSSYFSLLLVALVVGVLLANGMMRCPTCGKRVTEKDFRLGPVRLAIPFGWVERRCSRCGTDLNERRSSKDVESRR